MTETFNGWSNRETWAFMLHVSNDEGLSAMFADTIRDERSDPAYAVQRDAEALLTRAGYVDTFGGPWPDALADIAAEVGSLWRIDWAEVAEALTS
jgi:hypothetical protein